MSGSALACCALLTLPVACGGDAGESGGATQAALVAICTEDAASVPYGEWLCGEPRTVECDARNGASPHAIYVLPGGPCAGRRLSVANGPFALGGHDIAVQERLAPAGSGVTAMRDLCHSRLDVVDTTPPEANPTRTTLWPPNHRLHTISAQACAGVVDACDPDVEVQFTRATSDEPQEGQGDGAFEPDIAFRGTTAVALRAERQGSENGRVYTLHWLARDRAGHEIDGTCTVEVPHDRGSAGAVADAPAYSVNAPALP